VKKKGSRTGHLGKICNGFGVLSGVFLNVN